jgi:hypothetical protein
MGDQTKKYVVGFADGAREILAGSLSFTVSGDLVFEDEARNFQESYAKGYWISVREIRESH